MLLHWGHSSDWGEWATEGNLRSASLSAHWQFPSRGVSAPLGFPWWRMEDQPAHPTSWLIAGGWMRLTASVCEGRVGSRWGWNFNFSFGLLKVERGFSISDWLEGDKYCQKYFLLLVYPFPCPWLGGGGKLFLEVLQSVFCRVPCLGHMVGSRKPRARTAMLFLQRWGF